MSFDYKYPERYRYKKKKHKFLDLEDYSRDIRRLSCRHPDFGGISKKEEETYNLIANHKNPKITELKI